MDIEPRYVFGAILATLLIFGYLIYREIMKPEGEVPPKAVAAAPAKGGTNSNAKPAPEMPAATGRMGFRIVDADTGVGLPEVQSSAAWTANGQTIPRIAFRPNGDGRAILGVPEHGISQFRIRVRPGGYPAYSLTWNLNASNSLPKEYDFKIHKSVVIGAVVKNKEGNPVPGVKVVASTTITTTGTSPAIQLLLDSHSETTDTAGQWSCDDLPEGFENGLKITITHPDYLPTTFVYGQASTASANSISAADLRAQKATLILNSGLTMSGLVVDGDGKGVPDATVVVGQRQGAPPPPSGRGGSRKANANAPAAAKTSTYTTDSKGEFRVPGLKAGDDTLTVQAKHFAPHQETVKVEDGMKTVIVNLQPGKLLKGKVVDHAGAPVASAHIRAGNWRGARALDLDLTTDAEGKFEWDSAPSDEVSLIVDKAEFDPSNVRVKADGGEHLITLHEPRFALGTVIDEKNHAPVTNFTIVRIDKTGNSTSASRTNVTKAMDGSFKLPLSTIARNANRPPPGPNGNNGRRPPPQPNMANIVPAAAPDSITLRIEADGYYPQTAEPIGDEPGEVIRNFVLKRGTTITGTVVDAEKHPVAGAQVVAQSGNSRVFLNDGKLSAGGGADDTSVLLTTDTNGVFRLPPRENVTKLFAAHDSGFGETSSESFAKGKTIQLQPWGRIEGTTFSHGKPVATTSVQASPNIRPNTNGVVSIGIQVNAFVRSDSEGKFALTKLPPGDFWVYRVPQAVKGGAIQSVSMHRYPVTIKSGQTLKLDPGANESEVTGKAIMEARPDNFDWTTQSVTLRAKPVPPTGKNADEWYKSPEYLKLMQEMSGPYFGTFTSDGTFHVQDVAPGDYELTVNPAPRNGPPNGSQRPPPPRNNNNNGSRGTYSAAQPVHVPDKPDASGMLQLGEVKLGTTQQ